MKKALVLSLALLATTASATFSSIAPAAADDAMKSDAMMKIDCTHAGAMMSDATKGGSMMAMTGDTDKDFMAMAMEREKGTAMLMKIEASCGKDPKIKAMAAKEAESAEARMAMFRNQGMSQ